MRTFRGYIELTLPFFLATGVVAVMWWLMGPETYWQKVFQGILSALVWVLSWFIGVLLSDRR